MDTLQTKNSKTVSNTQKDDRDTMPSSIHDDHNHHNGSPNVTTASRKVESVGQKEKPRGHNEPAAIHFKQPGPIESRQEHTEPKPGYSKSPAGLTEGQEGHIEPKPGHKEQVENTGQHTGDTKTHKEHTEPPLENIEPPVEYQENTEHPDLNFPFIKALEKVASPRKEVLLALIDTGFLQMVVNFFLTSIKPLGITNYLILTMDPQTCGQLEKYSINCFQYRNFTQNGGHASEYGSKDFLAKMNIRTDMILEALHAGFSVLHSDVDMMFFKDPFACIPCPHETCDMAVLWDAEVYNAGFLFISPTNTSKRVYQSMKMLARKNPGMDDQVQLNKIIKQELSNKKSNSHISPLPTKQFKCGKYYYEDPKRYFADTMSPCDECTVAHNNWIVSMEAKVYRAKELHQWVYDESGYYTDTAPKYMTYQNPVTKASRKDEIEALQSALQVASILNRTVILPRFHQNQGEVPLISLVRVSKFDKQFQYRESSFLTHPLVPDVVKQSVFGPVLIKSRVSKHILASVNVSQAVIQYESSLAKGMNETEVEQKFGHITHSVLSFHSMYGAFSGLLDQMQNRIWRQKFEKGLKLEMGVPYVVYRQI